MATNDYFADIAMTAHPISSTDKEVLPVEIVEKLIKPCDEKISKEGIRFYKDLSDEEKMATFHSELAALREKYRPFLEDKTKPVKKEESICFKNFDFRFYKDGEVFKDNLTADDWEHVTIPDYRGPIGKWKAGYRTHFQAKELKKEERALLSFQCVDYKAVVYLNGSFVGNHEGFFAPFSFDVTDYLEEENELFIEIENDYSILGEGDIDGDKIYAATGLGWDDPVTGWHHCPAGAGVFGRVELLYVPTVRIDDIFARPNIDKNYIELRLGVTNYGREIYQDYKLSVTIEPKNFEDSYKQEFEADLDWVGMGKNEYRYRINMPEGYRLWTNDEPYLYSIKTELVHKENRTMPSVMKEHFGMRKFVSDENSTPKGKFYFNNEPILMRGANEMGHLPQCILNDDYEQLIDDILIAKLCHMNYYRLTQRPVQKEIYDYMDMLGMFAQTDLPLFSYLRRPQFSEAIRQTVEMEHLIRNHPCSFIVTFINEPVCIRKTEDPNSKFSKRYNKKGQRELLRDELEAFFAAARKAIYVENPDRVIKNVEGDYDAPTAEGMPDFHCYTMWYSNHGVPIGKLMRGYLPPVKEGWMIGCGEYGAEGLDNENLFARYPKEWLEKEADGSWYPTKIVRAQTNGAHGDWYKEQRTVSDWIRESQIHQEKATLMMTDAFRRRGDILSHTAIHLLIDAWPSGWMKTIVGCDRIPKKAYFAYKESLTPVRLSIRSDRRYFRAGEKAKPEIWLLNDTAFNGNVSVKALVSDDSEKTYASYSFDALMPSADSKYAASLEIAVPLVSEKKNLRLDAWLVNANGEIIYSESFDFYAYPPVKKAKINAVGAEAQRISSVLGFEECDDADTLLISDADSKLIDKYLSDGKTVVVTAPMNQDISLDLSCGNISTKKGPKVFFNVADSKYNLEYLYNENKDYIDFQCIKVIDTALPSKEIAYTYAKKSSDGAPAPKLHLPTAIKVKVGNASLYVLSLITEGRVGVNANLDALIADCINDEVEI